MKYALVINHDECFAPTALSSFFESTGSIPEKIFIVGRYTTTESQSSRLKYQLANFLFLGPMFCFNFIVGTAFKKHVLRDPEHHFDLMLKDYSLKYEYIEDVNSLEFLQEVSKLESPVIFNIASQLYKKQTLQAIKQTIYNIHPGCLKTNRGRYPAFWGAYRNLPNMLTCHELTEKIDAGDILAVLELEDPMEKTPARLTEQYAHYLPDILELALYNLKHPSLKYINDNQTGDYYPRPTYKDIYNFYKNYFFPNRKNIARA